jgi:alanine racemase
LETSPTAAVPPPCQAIDRSRGPLAHVDAAAIAANWRVFQKLGAAAECAAVVKADAYGLGADRAATALAKAGARTFFTATAEEAAQVRVALGEGPAIIALNGPAPGEECLYRDRQITPCLNSLEQAALWAQRPTLAPVIHIDTGMNRLGLRPDEVARAASLLGPTKPALVMSHLACASDPAHLLNARQRKTFIEAAKAFPSARLSLSASAGTQLGPAYAFDMIRPGIGLYGWDGMDTPTTPLSICVTLHAPVLQRRSILKGETAGYGATFTAPTDIEAVIVACGYADGFFRTMKGASVGHQGSQLPILGRVSMDLLIVDATDAPGLLAGDAVELVGETVRVEQLAAAAGTLPYEVFTTLIGRAAKIG